MKNKTFYTALTYWFLILGLVLFLSGCKIKKFKTDLKLTENENVSIVDNSAVQKNFTTEESEQKQKANNRFICGLLAVLSLVVWLTEF